MLKHRLILGPVLIALLVGLLWLDSTLERGWVVAAAIALVCGAGGVEFARLWRGMGFNADGLPTAFFALVGFAGVALSAWGPLADAAAWGPALVLVLSAVWYLRQKEIDGAAGAVGGAVLASVYLGVVPASMLLIREEFGAMVLMGVLAVTKSCDIGAYFTGVSIGKQKLIPWLSPGKTWEGLIGGLITASAVAVGLSQLDARLGIAAAAVGGTGVALAGQAGDLFESLLKRNAGVKDSGSIPGFGGVLDLLDSPLFAAPVALWLLRVAV